jgi:hypothetical protein
VMRGFVAAGLVVFHSAVAFASGASWFVTDPRPSRGFTVFLLWGSLWAMPLLFLISGMGVRYAMRTRCAAAFARERLARLLVPFAFGLVLLVPPMLYIEGLGRHGTEIVVHGRDADRGSAVAGTITAAGGKARFVAADLTDPAQLDHLAEQAGPVAQGQLHHRRSHCRRRRPHRHLIPAARQERRRIPGRHFLRYVSRHAIHARPCRTLTQPTPREGNTNREQFAIRSHL